MGQNDFILDGMRWSYSSVNTYNTCPQAFRLGYLDALPRVGNAFSDWGTFLHSLMERYFRGELEFFELSQVYVDTYKDNVVCAFPPNKYCDLSQRYYDAGKAYLDRFDGLFNDCEIVAVEERVKLNIDGRPFVGVIDLVVKDGDDYIVVDHKSKSALKTQKEKAEYARQLYLYAIYVKEKYGKWPTKLVFHMVRAGGELVEIPFVEADAEAAKQWFLSTIDAIYADETFMSKPNRIRKQLRELREQSDAGQIKFDDYVKQKKKLNAELNNSSFYCWVLCSSRENCPDKDKAPKEG